MDSRYLLSNVEKLAKSCEESGELTGTVKSLNDFLLQLLNSMIEDHTALQEEVNKLKQRPGT